MKSTPVLLTLPWLLAGAFTMAQTAALQPADARITDPAIQADHQGYEALQGRIKALNDGGRRVADYHLAKAQCWLDVSFHEYTRNDRGPLPHAALTESEKLVLGMEQRAALGDETPLVGEAVRLRPDLWARAQALRGQPGWTCAQARAACAEVELVHAGNEHAQLGWRHAKPYVQIAEDLLADADAQALACAPPVLAAAPVPPPAPVPVAPTPVPERIEAVSVVFNFDRSDARNIRPFSTVQLEELVRRVQQDGREILAVRLSGHADRLNSTGQDDYNLRLSERRVQTVRDLLVGLGVAADRIETTAAGDSQQVTGCEQRFSSQVDLRECLLPNRRVEVTVRTRAR